MKITSDNVFKYMEKEVLRIENSGTKKKCTLTGVECSRNYPHTPTRAIIRFSGDDSKTGNRRYSVPFRELEVPDLSLLPGKVLKVQFGEFGETEFLTVLGLGNYEDYILLAINNRTISSTPLHVNNHSVHDLVCDLVKYIEEKCGKKVTYIEQDNFVLLGAWRLIG